MKNLSLYLLFSFAMLCLYSCSSDEICTDCTEATTGVTSSFCDTESAVDLFESELISQGAAVNQSWSCVRK